MAFIRMADGTDLSLRYTQPATLSLDAIAHQLAQINRFHGAACRPYSVAEHSLLVLEIVEREFPHIGVHGRFAALMHDAHECITNDMATPCKAEIGTEWERFEDRYKRLVRYRFNFSTAAVAHHEIIHQADLIAQATEREQLLPPGGLPWPSLVHITPAGWANLTDGGRESFTWKDWARAFKDTAEALQHGRQEHAA